MKKIIYFLILILFPFYINALEITDYRIDINVLENGDINILEDFDIEGVYNGYKRIIKYKDNYQGYYGEFISSIGDSSIYNGTKAILNEVRGINFNLEIPPSEVKIDGDLFNKVNKAQKGDYGTYTILKKENHLVYLIYNPSKMNKGFYLDYTIENMIINHKDISELSMYIFSPLTININNLQIYIHVPNNKNLLKGWTHQKENSYVEEIDNNTIKLTYESLNANESVDFRIVFDLNAVDSNKKTNYYALNSIYEKEEELKNNLENPYEKEYKKIQDTAYESVEIIKESLNMEDYLNALEKVNLLDYDDKLKVELQLKLINLLPKIERKELIYKVIHTSILLFWIVGLIIIISKKCLKSEKENIKVDINNIHPNKLSYLLNRKIKLSDFISSILYLFEQEVILVEKKKNIYLIKNKNAYDEEDEKILKFLFNKKDKINLFKLKEMVFDDYEYYLSTYSNWYNSVLSSLEDEQYLEDTLGFKMVGIIYSIIGLVLGIFFRNSSSYISLYLLIFLSLISLIFFILFYKRTYKGKKYYKEVKRLKKYLNDFSILEELPNIEDWGKYLVYSNSIGCYEILSKTMINRFNSFDIKKYHNNYIKDKIYIQENIKKEMKNTIKNIYLAKKEINKTEI